MSGEMVTIAPKTGYAPVTVSILPKTGYAPVSVSLEFGVDETVIVISINTPVQLTAGDDGKSYSMDGSVSITLPAFSSITSGWNITLVSTVANGIVQANVLDGLGVVKIGGSAFAYAYIQNNANLTITYDGTLWVFAGTGAIGTWD